MSSLIFENPTRILDGHLMEHTFGTATKEELILQAAST
jgi:hypothetical protein